MIEGVTVAVVVLVVDVVRIMGGQRVEDGIGIGGEMMVVVVVVVVIVVVVGVGFHEDKRSDKTAGSAEFAGSADSVELHEIGNYYSKCYYYCWRSRTLLGR